MFVRGMYVTDDGYEWKEVDGSHYWRIKGTSDSWTLWDEDNVDSNQENLVSDSVVMGDVTHNKTMIVNDSEAIISAYNKGLDDRGKGPNDEIIESFNKTSINDFYDCEHCNKSLERIEITSWNCYDGANWGYEGPDLRWKTACFFCNDHGYWGVAPKDRDWYSLTTDDTPIIVYLHKFDEIDFAICQNCIETKSWETELSELQFTEQEKDINSLGHKTGFKERNNSKTIRHIINDGEWISTQMQLERDGGSLDVYVGFPRKNLFLGAFSTVYSNENMKVIARGDFSYNNTCFFKYLSEKRKSLFNQFMISLNNCIETEFWETMRQGTEEASQNRNQDLNWNREEQTNSERFQSFMEVHPDDLHSEKEVAANTNRFLQHYLHHREKSYKSFSLMSKTIWLMIGIILVSSGFAFLGVAVHEALVFVPLTIIGICWVALLFGVLHFEDKLLNPINTKENGTRIRSCPACGKNYPNKKWKKSYKIHSKECYNDVAKFMDNNDWLPPSFLLPCFSLDGDVGGGGVFFFFRVLFYPLFMPSRERLIKMIKNQEKFS